MLSYVAHIPSNPLLLECISRQAFSDFKKMSIAIAKIAQDINDRDIETIITITPAGIGFENAHSLNVSPEFEIKFNDFGDFSTQETAKGDAITASYIIHNLGTKYPISCVTNPRIDFASAVATMHMRTRKKKYKILPITHSLEPIDKLFSFGKSLRDVLEDTQEKIAVISIGDLYRASKKNLEKAKQMDSEILNQLQEKDTQGFLKNSSENINSLFARALRPLSVALGLVDDMQYDFDEKAYQNIHGTGLLAARFAI
ncbi:MAG: hypothetical protein CO042_04485 [Parcubacteria group bacterium CG_4_9_14_0_2_um_filter_41_8]|nr:MAG: hypothetical protein AUJ34_01965 [Parcubacteria group bacterium CG1_02_41_12]PIR56818.1 MAG: hypothetical protein COU72_04180 [Parcubacteria group bacterium CG10_big_fil_rev_8_21_14_0_10_41_35]PJC40294.1 MAG: hypothetical protein CO042_04485 [Parcubacteria group bacterium CG_4_9_14_0_2_um_filter_41_8]